MTFGRTRRAESALAESRAAAESGVTGSIRGGAGLASGIGAAGTGVGAGEGAIGTVREQATVEADARVE